MGAGRGRLAFALVVEALGGFVEAVGEVAPGLAVVQPWSRTEDEAVLRGIFEEAGMPGVTIDTDDDALPLPSADDWWRIVMGSGLRRTVAALGEPAAAAVRSRCTDYVEKHGVREVVTRSRYAVAVTPT